MRKEKLFEHFALSGMQPDIFLFDTVGSTNDVAKAEARQIKGEGIVIADEQTAGRGRRGHSFFSPKSKGLYFSVILRPKCDIADATALTTAAAVCVAEELKLRGINGVGIKWVNDIFVGERKVCGILSESVSDEKGKFIAVIVGIGINITTHEFPKEIKNTAGSIGSVADTDILAADIFIRLKKYCDLLPEKDFMDTYAASCFVIGKSITFEQNGKMFGAKALSVTKDGALEVMTEDGEVLYLQSGEISIKISR